MMEWLMFGAGWVAGWLVLGLLALLIVVWAFLAERRAVRGQAPEADPHERVAWPSDRPSATPSSRTSRHPLDVAVYDRSGRNGGSPWQS